jgi:hypothetical protein
VRRYFGEALAACVRLGYSALLVEEHLQGRRLSLADVFHIAIETTEQLRPILRRLAFVDVSADRSMENMRFAETVAVNRGATVRVFETVSEARAWLQEENIAAPHAAYTSALGSRETDRASDESVGPGSPSEPA